MPSASLTEGQGGFGCPGGPDTPVGITRLPPPWAHPPWERLFLRLPEGMGSQVNKVRHYFDLSPHSVLLFCMRSTRFSGKFNIFLNHTSIKLAELAIFLYEESTF